MDNPSPAYVEVSPLEVKDEDAKSAWIEPQPTISHWRLVPTSIGFTAAYAYVSLRFCISEMFAGESHALALKVSAGINIALVTLFLWSYVSAAATTAGRMPALKEPEEETDPQSRWFCKTCNIMKPLRTHHCRRCNRCVLKMDHHCFWINNCVGLHNMKYFYLTLVYGTLGTAYMLIIYLMRWASVFVYHIPIRWPEAAALLVSTAFIVAHVSTIAYLLGFHSFLLAKDRTSVEHRCCKGVKPGCDHDKGMRKNIEETFGSVSGFLLFPFPVQPILCSQEERDDLRELCELYGDHKFALPYFERMYTLRSKQSASSSMSSVSAVSTAMDLEDMDQAMGK